MSWSRKQSLPKIVSWRLVMDSDTYMMLSGGAAGELKGARGGQAMRTTPHGWRKLF